METSDNQGEKLHSLLKDRGIKLSTLAEKLGIARSTLYEYFKQEWLHPTTLYNIAKAAGIDLKNDFPQAYKHAQDQGLITEDPETMYVTNPSGSPECKDELLLMQRKYIHLLEKYNALLESKA